uniref:Uncharacterized protein n=1 Tax=Anguilla anguilla TaxID=7936 RepID=A0A0E9W171_ANGAN
MEAEETSKTESSQII